MKKIIFLLILFIYPASAEIVNSSGKHKHLGDKTKIQSCKIALERAKKNAIIQSSLGQTVSSEVISKCSEIEGEFDCERNQLSLFELHGDITSYKVTDKNYEQELGSEILFCKIDIEANVLPSKQNLDPTFHFNVKLNQEIFRSDEIIEIDINTSKPMYMAIFQWLPYGGKKNNKITKIFPNKQLNKNTKDLIEDNIKLKYTVNFPDGVKQKKVDEYLVFIASEKKIPWLNEYTEIEGLKSQLFKTKILMEKHYSGYIIIK